MTGVVVSPLTCTASDEQWSLQVPEVKTESASADTTASLEVKVDLVGESTLFTYSAETGLISLIGTTIGALCPATDEVTLEFRLSSTTLGEYT